MWFRRHPSALEIAARVAQQKVDDSLAERHQVLRDALRSLGVSVQEGTEKLIDAFAAIDKGGKP